MLGRQWLPGRPRKKWSECVMEDINLFGELGEEHVVQN